MKSFKSIILCNVYLYFVFFATKTQQTDGAFVTRRKPFLETPHFFENNGECNKEFLGSFSEVMMKTMCKPRPMAVEIIPPNSNVLVIPSKVIVNRCDGMCHAKQSCLATEKKVTKVMIQQMNLFEANVMPQCGVVHVEEHIRCKCKCTVMKEDCNEKQEYQAGECMCLCMNAEEKKNCVMEGRTWDDEKCSCMCPEMRECTTPLVWLPDYCKCAKLMEDDEVSAE